MKRSAVDSASECSLCGEEAKSLKRDFSDQAWSALLSWGEVRQEHVHHPMCHDCYGELRTVLAERVDEVVAVRARSQKTFSNGRQLAS